MISILKMIVGIFYRPKILKFWRVPAYKTYRAHYLGLVLAFVFVVWMQCDAHLIHNVLTDHVGQCDCIFSPNTEEQTAAQIADAKEKFINALVIVIWFALVTYHFGIWALLTAVLFIVIIIFMPYREYRFFEAFRISTLWYLGGYLGGVVLATLYNDILYLYIKFFRRRERRLLFAYDRDRIINIIKSPDRYEEGAFASTELPRDKRLYHFNVPPPSGQYTIAFVANPLFQIAIPNQSVRQHRDPIIKDRDLFLRCVAQAIQALAANEVLGRPEIWSRVRILTIFNDQIINRQFPLVEAYIPQILPSPNLSPNQDPQNFDFDGVVVPVANLDQLLQQLVNTINEEQPNQVTVNFNNIDIFYFMTAFPDFLRSSAQFTIDDVTQAQPFSFAVDSQLPHIIAPGVDHIFSPGKIALNVLGVRQKTYIHEFAHAMSSAHAGAIFDEYFDTGIIGNAINPALFAINRLQRVGPGAALPIDFGLYSGQHYDTDREHPSIEENWTGYYPERVDQNLCCTMDRTYGPYHLDKLICDFMYDRLIAKM